MMTGPVSYQELAEWCAEQIEKALPGLRISELKL